MQCNLYSWLSGRNLWKQTIIYTIGSQVLAIFAFNDPIGGIKVGNHPSVSAIMTGVQEVIKTYTTKIYSYLWFRNSFELFAVPTQRLFASRQNIDLKAAIFLALTSA